MWVVLSQLSHFQQVVYWPFFEYNFLSLCLQIFWSDSGELVSIATDESFFVLRYQPERVAAAVESKETIPEDGIEDAFEVYILGEQAFLFIFLSALMSLSLNN